MTEQFRAIAESIGIQCTAEPVGLAPRDVVAPLPHAEFHYLVTLARPDTDALVRIAFAKPLTDARPPTLSEVLWWLIGDAFALEQTQSTLRAWADTYGLPADAEGTARLFELQRVQTQNLRSLVGDLAYRRLLTSYESELVGIPVAGPRI